MLTANSSHQCFYKIYFIKGELGAILIYNKEDENSGIDFNPPLPKCKKVKICTLIVAHYGFKLGELFIKLTINFALKSKIDSIYLTHFTKENDRLLPLINDFGFKKYGTKDTKRNDKILEEDVYYKRLIPNIICKRISICFRLYIRYFNPYIVKSIF